MIRRPEYSMRGTGERIRELRRERNISVEQIRKFLQFQSAQAIYKWENGKCFPMADNLMALAKLFEVNPADIMVEDKGYIRQDLMVKILYFMEVKKQKEQRKPKYEHLWKA